MTEAYPRASGAAPRGNLGARGRGATLHTLSTLPDPTPDSLPFLQDPSDGFSVTVLPRGPARTAPASRRVSWITWSGWRACRPGDGEVEGGAGQASGVCPEDPGDAAIHALRTQPPWTGW